MKKRRLKIWPIFTIIIIILIAIMGFCVKDIYKLLKDNGQNNVVILSEIPAYGYSYNENDSKYFETLFKDLKGLLEGKEPKEENYVKLISQLFVTDFYSLNNALNKNDVGGEQFIWNDYRSDFVKKAKNSVYAYVENNIYGNRDQELPVVTNVEVTEIKQDKISFVNNDIKDENGYTVSVKITYEKDLGYPTECELIVIHNDSKLEIAQFKSNER